MRLDFLFRNPMLCITLVAPPSAQGGFGGGRRDEQCGPPESPPAIRVTVLGKMRTPPKKFYDESDGHVA